MDKQEAQRRADELCAAERRLNARRRGRRVPLFIRSADSRQLNRQREWELYSQARSNVFSAPSSSVTIILAPIVVGSLFAIFAVHPVRAAYAMAWIIALVIPFCIFVCHVHRELRRLARDESAGTGRRGSESCDD